MGDELRSKERGKDSPRANDKRRDDSKRGILSDSAGSEYDDGLSDDLASKNDDCRQDQPQVVETSPKKRFVRFNQKLGSGSYKTVYLGFDNDTGREVAWNVITFKHMSKQERKRIREEIDIAKSLDHNRIITFINAWINKQKEEVVFISERVTGGSLRTYINRLGAPLKIKVVRDWSRQILEGLRYLHTHEPNPVIHRDLKCDNIFINGNVGEILIGDLGLSTILTDTCAASIVGTPEFMAPELYEEQYGTGVDIYAFGMCLLEMVVRTFPYAECSTLGQIYRKVIAGEKPMAVARIKDRQLRELVELCIGRRTDRPTAEELLADPFLVAEDGGDQLCELWAEAEAEPIPPDIPTEPAKSEQASACSQECAGRSAEIANGRVKVITSVNLLIHAEEGGEVQRVVFNFDTTQDTASLVAKEMIESGIVPKDIALDDLIERIREATTLRANELLAQEEELPLQVLDTLPHNCSSPAIRPSIPVVKDNGSAPAPLSLLDADFLTDVSADTGALFPDPQSAMLAPPTIEEGDEAGDFSYCRNLRCFSAGESCGDVGRLQRGECSPEMSAQIDYLQQCLIFLIPRVRTQEFVMGQFCAATEAAVLAFQERHNVPQTGIVDEWFWEKLREGVQQKQEVMQANRDLAKQKAVIEKEKKKEQQARESAQQLENMMTDCFESLGKQPGTSIGKEEPVRKERTEEPVRKTEEPVAKSAPSGGSGTVTAPLSDGQPAAPGAVSD